MAFCLRDHPEGLGVQGVETGGPWQDNREGAECESEGHPGECTASPDIANASPLASCTPACLGGRRGAGSRNPHAPLPTVTLAPTQWRRKQNRLHLETLGRTVDLELYAQYLWKQQTNWKTRLPHTSPPPPPTMGKPQGSYLDSQ